MTTVATGIISSNVAMAMVLEKLSSLAASEFRTFYHGKDRIEELKSTLREIQNLLNENQLEDCLVIRLRATVYDAEDLIESWETEYLLWNMTTQVQGLHLPFNFNVVYVRRALNMLKEVTETLNKIIRDGTMNNNNLIGDSNKRRKESRLEPQKTGSAPPEFVFGREEDKKKIIKLLKSDEEASHEGNLSFIPIVGMGGLGKTTLAQLVYKHFNRRFHRHFDVTIWISVMMNSNVESILKQILVSHTSEVKIGHAVNSLSFSDLQNHVGKILQGKRFLLVLDDLWMHNDLELEPLKIVLRRGGKGSRVLVTSRSSKVSNIMGSKPPHLLKCLSDDELWRLFEKVAFTEGSLSRASTDERKELEVCGRAIVRSCKGLPLAVKQIGVLLREEPLNEWKSIVKRTETWKVDDDRVLAAVRLSYDHLPSPDHRKCFAYCALFPKAHLFEKDELVKLWMAETLIQPQSGKRTEDIGDRYFKELSERFFFECSTEDEGKYRMHDAIHDFAQEISSPFCCQVKGIKDNEPPNFNEKTRHISLLSKEVQQPILEIISRSKKLRTLLFPVQHLKAFGKVQNEIFNSLEYMRVLDLSSSTLLKLPKSIRKLKLLHYLDLSKTEIKILPNSICKLYNLETLKLLGCPWLLSLPKKLKNLVKLRHLELDEIFWYNASKLPQSMGCLTNLHNLHKFQVGCQAGYKLEELKNMKYLTGTLHISKLESAVNAREANLKEKEMIEKLVYEWSSSDLDLQDEATENQVLLDLQPHSRVQELQLCHYRGAELPIWMRDGQLQNLVTIYLNRCARIKVLILGERPHLKEIHLKNMLELEKWQEEKCPSLQKLTISGCPKLTTLPCIFPNLEFVKIKNCAALDTIKLPESQPKDITLINNCVLKQWTVNARGHKFLSNVKIIKCPELHALPGNICPRKLEIGECKSLHTPLHKQQVKLLCDLALDSLDECSGPILPSQIRSSIPLQSLVISNISNLLFLPIQQPLPSLTALHIRDCKDLKHLSNQKNKLFNHFTSLATLSIHNCPELVALPVEGLPTSLQYLSIGSCARLQSFGPPDVLRKLNSLHDLYIEDCPALHALPGGGLPKSLQHLSIQQCPSLIERCEMEDHAFIKDIPDLEIKNSYKDDRPATSSSSSAVRYHLPVLLGGCNSKGKGKMASE